VLCALASAGAVAGPSDALHAFASLGYSHDNNLFRLPDDSPGYDNTRGDSSRSVDAGLLFNQTYGRQVISAQAKVSKVSFSHFTVLDYNGKDMSVDWGWHLGNHLEGNAGATYNEVLAPYTDVVTNQRNLRTQQREYARGAWSFHPDWRARLSLSRDRYRYDLSSQVYNNHSDDQAEAGVDYLVRSGSTVGLQVARNKRKYDQLRPLGTQLVDAGSDQTDIKLKVVWRATPVTDVQFLGGRARRSYAYFTERDSRGFNSRLTVSSVVAGSVSLSGSAWHEFSSVDSNLFSYSLNTGASASALWAISSKLQATAQTQYLKRNFNGELAAALPVDFTDRTRNSSLGLTYVPLSALRLNASVYREARSGFALLGSGSYHANGVSFNANLQY
jgi:exopolysaccharide biosynthesis operon protein EpsL